ncbi:MAG TPA: circularly permuted type 2 ATP-grasp protein, partial [Novosphingobium sp.]|nr:circularly permuted type 2 ATP-grasp protein [Novosphingobium sp.]
VVSNRLVQKGVVVVASAGNNGTAGTFALGAPGVGRDVIAVSSFDNVAATLPAFTVSPDGRQVGYGPATGAPPPPTSGSLPMARTGTTASANDACNPVAPAPGSLAGQAALIRRGTCSFYEKAINAQNAGAAAVVLYNNAAGRISPTVAPPAAGNPPGTIPVVSITAADGAVIDGRIAMRTTRGYQAIDVLYRRVDDDYLDPLTFRPDSALGVSGIMDVYRAGGITIANAPGTGIADDKAIYSYMSEIVEFYTGEKPLLNNVPTWRCSEADSLAYVLDNLADLVVKEVHGSGGYGMLIGPTSTKKEIAAFAAKLRARPENYIAQPTLALSTVPIFTKAGLAPRHVDLRPFVLVSPKGIDITPGGLTRVALKKGSLVVNSSQGGGTKDSWVLED